MQQVACNISSAVALIGGTNWNCVLTLLCIGAPAHSYTTSSSKNGVQKKDLSFVCYCGNSSEEKVGVEEKTVKEGLGE